MGQVPEQPEFERPVDMPKTPAGQAVGLRAPSGLQRENELGWVREEKMTSHQKNPAGQVAVQAELVRPGSDPYVPAGHGAIEEDPATL